MTNPHDLLPLFSSPPQGHSKPRPYGPQPNNSSTSEEPEATSLRFFGRKGQRRTIALAGGALIDTGLPQSLAVIVILAPAISKTILYIRLSAEPIQIV